MRAFAALTLYVFLASVCLPALRAGNTDPVLVQIRQARRYLASGNYADAETCLRQALAQTQIVEPESVPFVRNALADLLREEGRSSEARPLYDETLRLPHLAPRVKFEAMAGIADMDGMTGDIEASKKVWTDAIETARQSANPLLEARALRGLGTTSLESGDASGALPLLRRSLSIQEREPAVDLAQQSATLTEIGRSYMRLDKLALAEDFISQALQVGRKIFGDTHPQIAYIMERLAEVYALRKEFTLARDYSSKAVEVMRSSCGDRSLPMAAALVNRANVEERANALDAAARSYADALRIAQENPGSTVFESRIIARYANVLKATHRNREARELSALAKSFHALPIAR